MQLRSAEVWEPIGPYVATAFDYAAHPTDDSILLIGTYFNGVYKSTNGGLNWAHLDSGFGSASVFSMAADETAPGTFYAATFERGIFKTTDSGGTWQQINTGLTNLNVSDVAVSPILSANLLAGTFSGLFYSQDGGMTWQEPASQVAPVLSVLHSDVFATVAYAGTDGNGVLLTDDGGDTWTSWNEGMGDLVVLDLCRHDSIPGIVYAGTNRGVWVRGAADSAWTDLTYQLPDANVTDVLFHNGQVYASTGLGVFVLDGVNDEIWDLWADIPARFIMAGFADPQKHIVAGYEGALEMSTDNGASFISVVSGIQNNFPDALATMRFSGKTWLLAGTDTGVWRAPDPGGALPLEWTASPDLLEHLVLELTPHHNRPGDIYAGTERAGVWLSTDGGANWEQKTDGIYPTVINDLAQSPTADNTFFCGTNVGFFISSDEGRTWRMGSQVAVPSLITAVEPDVVKEGAVYYGTTEGVIYRTINNGTFNVVADLGSGIRALRTARFQGVYAVTDTGEVYSQRENEPTWEPRPDGLTAPVLDLQVNQERPFVVYAGTAGGGVFKTVSDGTLWLPANSGIEDRYVFSLVVEAPDDSTPATVYGAGFGEIFRSTDGAITWQIFSQGLPQKAVTSLVMHPEEPGHLYASVLNDGVYQSLDAGETWRKISPADSLNRGALPLTFSETDPNELFVGTERQAIWRYDILQDTWSNSSTGITDLVRGIVISDADDDTLFAATLNSGVFRSDDGGESWNYLALEDRRLLHMRKMPDDPLSFYVATSNGLVQTQDGGETWFDLGQRMPFSHSLTYTGGDKTTLLLGGVRGTLYKTDLGTDEWLRVGGDLPENTIDILQASHDDRLYAGIDASGLYASEDQGLSWELISTDPNADFSNDRVVSIAPEPTFEKVFVAGLLNGLFVVDPDGQNWINIPLPRGNYAADPLTGVLLDPFDPQRLYVSRANQSETEMSIHVSTDYAQSWTTVPGGNGLPAGSVFDLAAFPDSSGQLLCAHVDGLYFSANHGLAWMERGLQGITISKLFVDPDEPDTVYAAGFDGGVYVTRDRGATWSSSDLPGSTSVAHFLDGPEEGGILAASYSRGLLESVDHGQTWSEGVSEELSQPVINFLAMNPVAPNTLYAASSALGVLKSTKAGLDLQPSNAGLEPHTSLLTLHLDAQDPFVLYAGSTTGGVYTSEDEGLSWAPLTDGMFHELIIAMAIDPDDHRVIYAGVEGGGVYRIRRDQKLLKANADPDQDQLATVLEELMGLDPLRQTPFMEGVPLRSDNGDSISIEWPQAQSFPQGVEILGGVEWSFDLAVWNPVRESETVSGWPTGELSQAGTLPDGRKLMRHLIDLSTVEQDVFLRLKAERAE